MKNSGAVIMTIVNPDETSKADLLHFIKVGDEFKAVAGPDIKSGGSTYVFNQWKKIVTSRHDISMVDFDGVLTTEEGLKQLNKRERLEFEELCDKFPRKRPLPSMCSNQDELYLRIDYFKDLLEMEGEFHYSLEVSKLLKSALTNQDSDKLSKSDWSEFNKRCKEIFRDFNETSNSIENDSFTNGKIAVEHKAKSCNDSSNSSFRKKVKEIPWEKVIGGVAAGTVLIGSAVVGMANLKNSNTSKSKIGDKVRKVPWRKTIKGVAKLTFDGIKAVGEYIVSEKSGTIDVSSNANKEPLGGTHASPVLHSVRGVQKKKRNEGK